MSTPRWRSQGSCVRPTLLSNSKPMSTRARSSGRLPCTRSAMPLPPSVFYPSSSPSGGSRRPLHREWCKILRDRFFFQDCSIPGVRQSTNERALAPSRSTGGTATPVSLGGTTGDPNFQFFIRCPGPSRKLSTLLIRGKILPHRDGYIR